MKVPSIIAIFAGLLSISLIVGNHDESVAPLQRALGQRSIGRVRVGVDEAVPHERERGGVAGSVEASPRENVPAGREVSDASSVVAAVAAGIPADDVEEFAPVEASLPGNTVRVNQRTVAVRGFRSVPGTSGVALAVSVSVPQADVSTGNPVAVSEPPITSSRSKRGLSYEEQLFRTKWGWSAFADVQQTALEAHSD